MEGEDLLLEEMFTLVILIKEVLKIQVQHLEFLL